VRGGQRSRESTNESEQVWSPTKETKDVGVDSRLAPFLAKPISFVWRVWSFFRYQRFQRVWVRYYAEQHYDGDYQAAILIWPPPTRDDQATEKKEESFRVDRTEACIQLWSSTSWFHHSLQQATPNPPLAWPSSWDDTPLRRRRVHSR
jgi:hypothetical protein